MNCIVNVDKNWGIGLKNKLLVSIPADLRFFQSKTKGKVVIFGRSTLETFPAGKPLKNRVNIIITRNPSYSVPDALVAHSVQEALTFAKDYDTDDVFIIGGASIYRQFLPYCDTAYVTKTDHCFDADTYFPNLDEDSEWECVEEGEEQTCYDIEFRFTKYVRVKQPE